MSVSGRIGLGVIGAGRFAEFVAAAASELDDGVRIVAVTDASTERARALARTHGAAALPDVPTLLTDDRVDAVIIATPPNTHAALTVAALSAGRHVFCEKPVALTGHDAEHVRKAVAASGCTYVVDHVLRFNPILAMLRRLRDAGLVGPVRRLAFENDASDEDLPPGHWFWDEATSGGILLEHGVHFFDAAAALIGAPVDSVQALAHTRPDGRTDTVVCTAVHTDGALASYAHGFTHSRRAERQLMRIDLGLAEARIHGWIPLRCDLDVWTDDPDAFETMPARATELLAVPGYRASTRARVDVRVERDAMPARRRADDVPTHARHHVRAVVDLGWPDAKEAVYRESVRAALSDLVTGIRTGATPRADVDAGAEAVAVAVAATQALADGATHHLATTKEL